MKFRKIVGVGLVLGIALSFIGCRTYDEGPSLSFRFRETRIEGFWYFEKYEVTTGDSTYDAVEKGYLTQEDAYAEFTKGGFYEIVNEASNPTGDSTGFAAESGVWHMGGGWKGTEVNGVEIKNGNMYIDKNDRFIECSILKMTNDHFKYYYTDTDPLTGEKALIEVWLTPKIL